MNFKFIAVKCLIIVFIFSIPGNAHACSSEYFALSRALLAPIPSDQIARQMYENRKEQAQAALDACRRTERAAARAEEERRREADERARQDAQRATQLQNQATVLAQSPALSQAQQQDQLVNSAVSQAILQGRCEAAKQIALSKGRLDVAEQAVRLCIPEKSVDKSSVFQAELNSMGQRTQPSSALTQTMLINGQALITSSDYPVLALSEGRSGSVGVRVGVLSDGMPAKCEIMQSSGHADLDDVACWIFMKRAKFTPAQDKNGKTWPSYYITRVTWK